MIQRSASDLRAAILAPLQFEGAVEELMPRQWRITNGCARSFLGRKDQRTWPRRLQRGGPPPPTHPRRTRCRMHGLRLCPGRWRGCLRRLAAAAGHGPLRGVGARWCRPVLRCAPTVTALAQGGADDRLRTAPRSGRCAARGRPSPFPVAPLVCGWSIAKGQHRLCAAARASAARSLRFRGISSGLWRSWAAVIPRSLAGAILCC